MKSEKEFKSQMNLMIYYFPEFKKLSSTFCMFALPDPEAAGYLRTQRHSAITVEANTKFAAIKFNQVFREMRQLRRVVIMKNYEFQTENEISLAK